MYIKKVFDNEGETADRYTIHAVDREGEKYTIFAADNVSPNGVFMTEEGHSYGDMTGKPIPFQELPREVQGRIFLIAVEETVEARYL